MNKKLLISIDTEGDNLWDWSIGKKITTENALYIPQFQKLCEEYYFKPVYLTNYEMANDNRFVGFAKEKQFLGKCEIGMHLHAWNTPPFDENLPVRQDCVPGAPYLIEYSDQSMEEKIKIMTELLTEKFEFKPISHRAGRWAMNDVYFKLLDKNGYQVDCSVTPGIDWGVNPGQSLDSKGSNYKYYCPYPYFVSHTKMREFPVTVFVNHKVIKPDKWTISLMARSLIHSIKGNVLWLRPTGKNLNECLFVLNEVMRSKDYEYAMFMLHSSELMPGGSPTFKNTEQVKVLNAHIQKIFEKASKLGFDGITFREIVANKG